MPFLEDNGDIASFEAMTPEERLNTLLSETEDVARENQIFLREGAEMAMAKKKRNQLMRPCPRIIRIIQLPSHRLMVQRY